MPGAIYPGSGCGVAPSSVTATGRDTFPPRGKAEKGRPWVEGRKRPPVGEGGKRPPVGAAFLIWK